ncbi:MAG: hypothetical protein BMS9Abin26_0342 [Gammaproteobacteria bacterium]|nr:MAG: hypothetical protein BMS9Abin26_0342 [Gammaproteobacteria bacterium]
MTRFMTVVGIMCLPVIVQAQNFTKQELEEWFFDESDAESLALEVNEGELEFINAAPEKDVYHHLNVLTITDSSLDDGIVTLRQCHGNIDRVGRAQIMFSRTRVTDLKIVEVANIEKAWVEDNSVQLEDIKKGARLCVQARSKALTRNADGSYVLKNGPFMRKFLDGYYPMHVSIDVRLKTSSLHFTSTEPVAQRGFKVWQTPGAVHADAWFEGRLRTAFYFYSDREVSRLSR